MATSDKVKLFWRKYIGTLDPKGRVPTSYDVWHFGDTEKLANELAELVKTGQKSATSALVWESETKGEKEPRVGDVVVVTYWNGNPSCIIEITEADVRPFSEIDGSFAHDYGEGNRSLKWWREAMWEYYSEICRKIGRKTLTEYASGMSKVPLAVQRNSCQPKLTIPILPVNAAKL